MEIVNSKKKLLTIVCPKCGMEYLPAEIYLPDTFIGKPYNIERAPSGKIDMFDGCSMDVNEDYICDRCGTKFKVSATVQFKAIEYNAKNQFSESYISPMNTERISLFEGD